MQQTASMRPRRIPEAGLIAIGYDRDLILPLKVTPQDASKPVTLRLKLSYAICEKLCVPAEAKGELTLAGGGSAQDAPLALRQRRADLCCLHWLVRQPRHNQGRKNLLGLQAPVPPAMPQPLRQLFPESFRL